MMKTEELKLVQEWDKVFPKSEKVDHKKVTFVNHFGITLAADIRAPPVTAFPGQCRSSKSSCTTSGHSLASA